MSTTKLEEGIVGVDETSNQAMIQQFSITLPGIYLNFQRPVFILQDRFIYFFCSSYNALAGFMH